MSTLTLRILERIHGHLGWLAVAALLHPAIVLRRSRRRAPLAVGLATAFAFATGLVGAWVYPSYRQILKQHIFIEQPALGWSFERKEHLAVGVLAFALAGCVAHWVAPRFEGESGERMAKLAHRAFVVAFALSLVVAAIGVAVASYKSF